MRPNSFSVIKRPGRIPISRRDLLRGFGALGVLGRLPAQGRAQTAAWMPAPPGLFSAWLIFNWACIGKLSSILLTPMSASQWPGSLPPERMSLLPAATIPLNYYIGPPTIFFGAKQEISLEPFRIPLLPLLVMR